MTVFINNEKREFSKDPNIVKLLREVNLERKKGIAVAVNNQVVPKNTWEQFLLKENDKVIIIHATQGG